MSRFSSIFGIYPERFLRPQAEYQIGAMVRKLPCSSRLVNLHEDSGKTDTQHSADQVSCTASCGADYQHAQTAVKRAAAGKETQYGAYKE